MANLSLTWMGAEYHTGFSQLNDNLTKIFGKLQSKYNEEIHKINSKINNINILKSTTFVYFTELQFSTNILNLSELFSLTIYLNERCLKIVC